MFTAHGSEGLHLERVVLLHSETGKKSHSQNLMQIVFLLEMSPAIS